MPLRGFLRGCLTLGCAFVATGPAAFALSPEEESRGRLPLDIPAVLTPSHSAFVQLEFKDGKPVKATVISKAQADQVDRKKIVFLSISRSGGTRNRFEQIIPYEDAFWIGRDVLIDPEPFVFTARCDYWLAGAAQSRSIPFARAGRSFGKTVDRVEVTDLYFRPRSRGQ